MRTLLIILVAIVVVACESKPERSIGIEIQNLLGEILSDEEFARVESKIKKVLGQNIDYSLLENPTLLTNLLYEVLNEEQYFTFINQFYLKMMRMM